MSDTNHRLAAARAIAVSSCLDKGAALDDLRHAMRRILAACDGEAMPARPPSRLRLTGFAMLALVAASLSGCELAASAAWELASGIAGVAHDEVVSSAPEKAPVP